MDDDGAEDEGPHPPPALYHERQRLALCAVHAVNNLLQRAAHTPADFDAACAELAPPETLAWWAANPHRSRLGIGDYDANVVLLLLARHHDLTADWWDPRHAVGPRDLAGRRGALWNVPSPTAWGRLTGGRHWVALLCRRRSGADGAGEAGDDDDDDDDADEWIDLDSRRPAPEVVGSPAACAARLNARRHEAHLLLIR